MTCSEAVHPAQLALVFFNQLGRKRRGGAGLMKIASLLASGMVNRVGNSEF